MSRKPKLTERQQRTIRENIDLFPAEILKLPEFSGTTVSRDTIRNYQVRIKSELAPAEEAVLASSLERYINRHGLPSRFHGHGGVTGFLQYLKNLHDDSTAES